MSNNLINWQIDPSKNFEPSSDTKEMGLSTYKQRKEIIGGFVLPGFYQTVKFHYHLIGFFLIFLLEGVATAWSYEQGASIAVILGLIILDIVLAIVSHRWHGKINMLSNQIIFYKENERDSLKAKRNKLKLLRNLFYFLILASAFAKFYFFFIIYLFFDATALLIGFAYLLAGVLHILCTGYVWYTLRFSMKINSEYTKFRNKNEKVYSAIEFPGTLEDLEEGAKLIKVTEGKHTLSQGENGEWTLHTIGVLSDHELGNMVTLQNTEFAKMQLAKQLVKRQYDIMARNPVLGGKEK